MRLGGKVAIVTGTSPNIGGGIAEAFSVEGAQVVCVDALEENASQCAQELRRQGRPAIGMVCDVTDEKQVQDVVAAAESEFGGVDVLVNGAVQYNMKGLLKMPVDEFRRQIDIILTGTFLFTQNVARLMIRQKRGGSIIHLASTEGHQGNPENVGYCSGKGGLLNMTRANAVELAPYGIRVNSLTPTSTDPTESVDRAERWGRPRWDISDAIPFKRGRLLPMGHPPSPSDYAQAAIFLASEESKMVTGIDLRVDAGAVARFWAYLPPAADPSAR